MTRVLRWFGRETSGAALIPEMDGFRFFAIMAVVLHHIDITMTRETSRFFSGIAHPGAAVAFGAGAADSHLHALMTLGRLGVQLFFVISGFVLGLPFARYYLKGTAAVSLPRYFLRRVTRLEPPYLINLALLTAVWILYKHQPSSVILPHTAASAVYLHNVIYFGEDPISSVIWSLEVEVQFYILAPLLATVFAIRSPATRRAVLVGGILLSAAFRPWVMSQIPYAGTIFHQLHYFLAGFLLVDLYLTEWQEAPTRHWAWDLAVLGSVVAGGVVFFRRDLIEFTAPFIILVGYVGAFRGVVARAIVRNPWVYTIGGMCYTIYLYHVMVIIALKPLTTRVGLTERYDVNFLIQVALMVPVVVGVSAVLFLLVERPFMRRDWPQALAARVRALVPGSVTSG